MTKIEFLEGLRAALSGDIPEEVISENLRFYEHYIQTELASGRNEEDIVGELGGPNVIAKTIMETWQSQDTDLEIEPETADYEEAGEETEEESEDRFYSGFFGQDKSTHVERDSDAGSDHFYFNGKEISSNAWYLKWIPILIAVLIVIVAGWILSGLLHLTVSLLRTPIFWILIAVIVFRNISRWRK